MLSRRQLVEVVMTKFNDASCFVEIFDLLLLVFTTDSRTVDVMDTLYISLILFVNLMVLH